MRHPSLERTNEHDCYQSPHFVQHRADGHSGPDRDRPGADRLDVAGAGTAGRQLGRHSAADPRAGGQTGRDGREGRGRQEGRGSEVGSSGHRQAPQPAIRGDDRGGDVGCCDQRRGCADDDVDECGWPDRVHGAAELEEQEERERQRLARVLLRARPRCDGGQGELAVARGAGRGRRGPARQVT